MKAISGKVDPIILFVSLACLYAIPHFLDKWIVPIGAAFGLIMIISCRPVNNLPHLRRYAAYLAISMITYFILFQNQPWDFLFGWLPENVSDRIFVPVMVCSVIMSFSAVLLLAPVHMPAYLLITLLIQLPMCGLIHIEAVEKLFDNLAHAVLYRQQNTARYAFWQLLWLLNYYLPLYFLSRKKLP